MGRFVEVESDLLEMEVIKQKEASSFSQGIF